MSLNAPGGVQWYLDVWDWTANNCIGNDYTVHLAMNHGNNLRIGKNCQLISMSDMLMYFSLFF